MATISKTFITTIGILISSCSLNAQNDSKFAYGLKFGGIYSSIDNLETTILSEPYFIHYTLKSEPRYGWTAGGFVNYRFHDNVAFLFEMMFAKEGSNLLFNNYEKDFNWKMQFAYQYLNVVGLVKIYPFGKSDNALNGINIGIGPHMGFNIAPQKIIYASGGTGKLPAFGDDLDQQQQLRNVLKGKNDFGFNLGLGYDFASSKVPITLDVRYHMAFTDAVETQANSYNFIENKNTSSFFQFSIGLNFSFFNRD